MTPGCRLSPSGFMRAVTAGRWSFGPPPRWEGASAPLHGMAEWVSSQGLPRERGQDRNTQGMEQHTEPALLEARKDEEGQGDQQRLEQAAGDLPRDPADQVDLRVPTQASRVKPHIRVDEPERLAPGRCGQLPAGVLFAAPAVPWDLRPQSSRPPPQCGRGSDPPDEDFEARVCVGQDALQRRADGLLLIAGGDQDREALLLIGCRLRVACLVRGGRGSEAARFSRRSPAGRAASTKAVGMRRFIGLREGGATSQGAGL